MTTTRGASWSDEALLFFCVQLSHWIGELCLMMVICGTKHRFVGCWSLRQMFSLNADLLGLVAKNLYMALNKRGRASPEVTKMPTLSILYGLSILYCSHVRISSRRRCISAPTWNTPSTGRCLEWCFHNRIQRQWSSSGMEVPSTENKHWMT